jgi:hypothetical protein
VPQITCPDIDSILDLLKEQIDRLPALHQAQAWQGHHHHGTAAQGQ